MANFSNTISWVVDSDPIVGNPSDDPGQSPPNGSFNTALYTVFTNTQANKEEIDLINNTIALGVSGSFKNFVIVTSSTVINLPVDLFNFKITAIGGGGGGASYLHGGPPLNTGEGGNGGNTVIHAGADLVLTAGGGFGGRYADSFESDYSNMTIGDGGFGGDASVGLLFSHLPVLLLRGGPGDDGMTWVNQNSGHTFFNGSKGGDSYLGHGDKGRAAFNYGTGGSGDGRTNNTGTNYTIEFGGGGGGGGTVILADTNGSLAGKSLTIQIGSGGVSDYAYAGRQGVVILEF